MLSPHDYLTLYVNIPFCRERCSYCLYYRESFNRSSEIDAYLDVIEEEAKDFGTLFVGVPVRALYIGGGTPSLLTAAQILRLADILTKEFEILSSDENCLCFEAHPSYLSVAKITAIAETRLFNRLSLGFQSADRSVVEESGRFYTPIDRLARVVSDARCAWGARKLNINVDLMYGLNKDSLQSLFESFSAVAALGVSRISVYFNRFREIAEGGMFREEAIDVMARLSEYISSCHDEYALLNNSQEDYNEVFAWGLHGKMIDREYRFPYNSGVLDYNNNLGLGVGASSHIIPSQKMYWNAGSNYKESDADLCKRHMTGVAKRRCDGPRRNSFNF